MRRSFPAEVGAVGLAVLLALTACSGGTKKPAANSSASVVESSTSSSAPAPSSSPASTPPAPLPVNPLTGLAPVPVGAVIAVKIDDTGNGRPQRNINLADIVYIEQAEGGLSRLVAVYSTNKPIVEPVRSVRASDPELLLQYGKITLVASGGGGDSLPTLDHSGLSSFIDDRGEPGFTRDRSRSAPYNLQSNLATVTAKTPGTGSKSIGFTWSVDLTQASAGPVANTLSTQVGSTAVRFDYDPTANKYRRVINGTVQNAADGSVIATPNVIVQYCDVTVNTKDRDVNGNPSQYTHSIGSGPVSVFRNGHRIDGTWSRASTSAGTTLTDKSGQPIALAPGGAWVVLVDTGTELDSS